MSAAQEGETTPGQVSGISENPRSLRRNFLAGVTDAAGWGVGTGLLSHTTLLPLFVRNLTHDPLAIGLIPAAMYLGWLLPGIFVANWVERLPRVKYTVMWIAVLERCMPLLLGFGTLALGRGHPQFLLALFFFCWFGMNAAVGANTPAYYKLIAKTIPAELRGRMYGVGGAISGFLGVGAAVWAGWLIKSGGFPRGYAWCFLSAFVVQTMTVLPLGFMHEPVQARGSQPERQGMGRILGSLRHDTRLLWISAAVGVFGLNQMASGFYALFAISRFGATDATVAGFTAVVMGVRALSFLLTGWMGDRWGNKVTLSLSAAAGIAAAVAALLAPSLGWMYAVFALNELATQGWAVCAMNYVLELCPPERSSTYTAVFNLCTGPLRVLLPLAGGGLIEYAGYPSMFAAAVIGGIASAAILHLRLPEPRRQPALLTPTE